MVAGGVKSSSVELSTANVLVNIMLSTAEIFIQGSPNWKELSSALPSGPTSFMKGININDQIFFFGNRMCIVSLCSFLYEQNQQLSYTYN